MEGQQYRVLNTVVHSKYTTVDFYETHTHTHTHTLTHTLTHPQVDIGEQQFLVATMDDGGMVRASKDVQRPGRVEWFQRDWLRTQDNSLTAAELTCNDGGWGD